MTNERPPIRIGTAERDAAMKALDAHLEAGRLDVDEYGERSARASVATHPPLPGIAGPPLPAVAPPAPPARTEPSGLEVWGPRLVALSPFIAVALFLLTRQWVFFLLIPVAGVLLGSQRRDGDGRRRRG
jgi:hypothetical protein